MDTLSLSHGILCMHISYNTWLMVLEAQISAAGVLPEVNKLRLWQSRSKLQPRSQGLRGETVTKTLVKFILSFQNLGKKSHAQCDTTVLQYIWIRSCRTAHTIFFPKFWNDKMNFTRVFVTVSPWRPWDRGCQNSGSGFGPPAPVHSTKSRPFEVAANSN